MLLDLLDLLDLLLKSQRAEGAFSQGSPVCFAGFWPSIPDTQFAYVLFQWTAQVPKCKPLAEIPGDGDEEQVCESRTKPLR